MAKRRQGDGTSRAAGHRVSPTQSFATTMSQALLLNDDAAEPQRAGGFTHLPQEESLATLGLRLSRQFAQCRRKGEQLALLWVEVEVLARPDAALSDADRLSLIQTVSLRLRNRVRGADEVVHMGGCVFTVLLQAVGTAEAATVETRLLQALRGAYGVDGRLMQLGVRLGLAMYPEAGRNGAELAAAARKSVADAG
jgi:GGDEF domain-containing protein